MIYSVKYTDNGMSENVGGYIRAWFIFIHPKYKDDIGLLEHEKTHVSQFWGSWCLHSMLYKFWRAYRQRSEIEAYREQLRWSPESDNPDYYRPILAERLAVGYNLNITIDEAIKLLSW